MIFRRLTIIIALFCCIAGIRTAAATDSVTISKRLAVIERAVPLPYHRSLTRDIKQFSSKALPADYASFETFIDHELSKRAYAGRIKIPSHEFKRHESRLRREWSLQHLSHTRYEIGRAHV